MVLPLLTCLSLLIVAARVRAQPEAAPTEPATPTPEPNADDEAKRQNTPTTLTPPEAAPAPAGATATANGAVAPKVGAVPDLGMTNATSDPAASEPQTDADDGGDAYPRLEAGARLLVGAERRKTHPTSEQVEADSRQPFFLQQARVKLRAEMSKRVRLSFSADLDGKPAIRSAFAQFRFKRALQLRVGRFKRPFSRLELTSVGQLPFRERGLFNRTLIEDAGWGDRALGAMALGKLKGPRLRYALALTNSAPSVDVQRFAQLRGADVIGRLEWSPIKPLTFALNGGHKVAEARIDGPNQQLNAFGGDIEWDDKHLTIMLDALAAQNPYPPTPPMEADRTPWAFTVVGYMAYAFDLGGDFDLQPVLVGDYADTDTEVSEDETLRVIAGINLRYRKSVRVMPQLAIIQPIGQRSARSQLAEELYQVVLSVEL